MEVHGRREDRMTRCEGGGRWRKSGSPGGRLGRGRKRGHCVGQGRKADRGYDWSIRFPPRYLSCIKVSVSLPPRASLPSTTSYARTPAAHRYTDRGLRGGSWNNGTGCDYVGSRSGTANAGIYGLLERTAPSRSGEHDEERRRLIGWCRWRRFTSVERERERRTPCWFKIPRQHKSLKNIVKTFKRLLKIRIVFWRFYDVF